jgi:hypothetical protein
MEGKFLKIQELAVAEVPRVTGVRWKHLLSRGRVQLSHLNFFANRGKYFLGSWQILAATDKSVFAEQACATRRNAAGSAETPTLHTVRVRVVELCRRT